jgi:hypothetical protein
MSTLEISRAYRGPPIKRTSNFVGGGRHFEGREREGKEKKSKGASESTFEGRAGALKPNTRKWDFTSKDHLEARHASERWSDLLVIDMYTSTRFTR